MTEQENKAIKWMQNVRDDAVVTLDHIAKEEPNVSPMLYAGRKEKAETIIKGFEELEKYRDLEQKLNGVDLVMLANHWMEMEAEGEVKGYQRGRVLTNEDADQWDAYKEIGTPAECRLAVEKHIAKKPIRNDKCTCPSCGTHNEVIKKRRNTVYSDIVYCWHCGQALKIFRSDEE